MADISGNVDKYLVTCGIIVIMANIGISFGKLITTFRIKISFFY